MFSLDSHAPRVVKAGLGRTLFNLIWLRFGSAVNSDAAPPLSVEPKAEGGEDVEGGVALMGGGTRMNVLLTRAPLVFKCTSSTL